MAVFALLPNFLLPHPYDVEARHAMIRRPDRCDEATDRRRRCKQSVWPDGRTELP